MSLKVEASLQAHIETLQGFLKEARERIVEQNKEIAQLRKELMEQKWNTR